LTSLIIPAATDTRVHLLKHAPSLLGCSCIVIMVYFRDLGIVDKLGMLEMKNS